MDNLNSKKLELFKSLNEIIMTFDSSEYNFSALHISNSMVGEMALDNYEPVKAYIDEKDLWLTEQQEILCLARNLLEKCISERKIGTTEDARDLEKKKGLIWKIINMHLIDRDAIHTGLLTNDLSPVIAQFEKNYTDSSRELQNLLTDIAEIKNFASSIEK